MEEEDDERVGIDGDRQENDRKGLMMMMMMVSSFIIDGVGEVDVSVSIYQRSSMLIDIRMSGHRYRYGYRCGYR